MACQINILWHLHLTFCLIVAYFHISLSRFIHFDFNQMWVQTADPILRAKWLKFLPKATETIDAYKQIQHMLDADTFSRYKWSTISISYTITWTLAIGNCSFGLIRKHCFGYMYAHLIAYCACSKLFALLQCFPRAHRERESGSINWDKLFYLFNWNPDEKPVHSSFQLLLLLFCLLFFLTVLYFFHALASPLFFRINIK